jgi:hypothetical protein
VKNERTPRTLADCQWLTGYQSANPAPRPWGGWWLAVVIGVSLALVLAYGGRA